MKTNAVFLVITFLICSAFLLPAKAKAQPKKFRASKIKLRSSSKSLLSRIQKDKRAKGEADSIARLMACKKRSSSELNVRLNALARRLKTKDKIALHEAVAMHFANRLKIAKKRTMAQKLRLRKTKQPSGMDEQMAENAIDEAKSNNEAAKEAFKQALKAMQEASERRSESTRKITN